MFAGVLAFVLTVLAIRYLGEPFSLFEGSWVITSLFAGISAGILSSGRMTGRQRLVLLLAAVLAAAGFSLWLKSVFLSGLVFIFALSVLAGTVSRVFARDDDASYK